MDIVGKHHRNTERLRLRLQEREARLLARAQMEQKRLARTVTHRAKAHTLARKQQYDRISQEHEKEQAQALQPARQPQEQVVHVPQHTQEQQQRPAEYNFDHRQRVVQEQTVQQEADFGSSERIDARISASSDASDTESYFDLSQESSLQDYMRSLRVSVQEQGGSLFTHQSSDQSPSREQGREQGTAQVTSVRQRVSVQRSAVGGIFLFVLAASLLIFTALTIVDIGFWLFFFSLLIWRIDSRLSIGLALVCLVGIPLLLSSARIGFDRGEDWAEIVAVWAYLFLVIGVVVQIWEYITRKS